MKKIDLADIGLALVRVGARNHALALAAMIIVMRIAIVAGFIFAGWKAGPVAGAALTRLAVKVGRSMLN